MKTKTFSKLQKSTFPELYIRFINFLFNGRGILPKTMQFVSARAFRYLCDFFHAYFVLKPNLGRLILVNYSTPASINLITQSTYWSTYNIKAKALFEILDQVILNLCLTFGRNAK